MAVPVTVRVLAPSANFLALSTTKLINGDITGRYPSAPALVEDPSYPMSNLLNGDRYIPWMHPGGGGAVKVEFDLGSNKSIAVFGLLALAATPGGFIPFGCDLAYRLGTGSSPLFGYDVNGYTDLSASGGHLTLTGSPRDIAVHGTFNTVSARYVRATFTTPIPGVPFIVGGIVIGGAPIDLGTPQYFGQDALYSPGAVQETVRSRVVNRSYGGVAVQTETGLARRRFTYGFEVVNRATRDVLRSIASSFAQSADQLLITPEGEACSVWFPDDAYKAEHLWGSTSLDSLYNVRLVMESQP